MERPGRGVGVPPLLLRLRRLPDPLRVRVGLPAQRPRRASEVAGRPHQLDGRDPGAQHAGGPEAGEPQDGAPEPRPPEDEPGGPADEREAHDASARDAASEAAGRREQKEGNQDSQRPAPPEAPIGRPAHDAPDGEVGELHVGRKNHEGDGEGEDGIGREPRTGDRAIRGPEEERGQSRHEELPIVPWVDEAHEHGRQQVRRSAPQRGPSGDAQLAKPQGGEDPGEEDVDHELPAHRAMDRNHEREEGRGIEDVAVHSVDEGEPSEDVWVPERKGARRPHEVGVELPGEVSEGDGVGSEQDIV